MTSVASVRNARFGHPDQKPDPLYLNFLCRYCVQRFINVARSHLDQKKLTIVTLCISTSDDFTADKIERVDWVQDQKKFYNASHVLHSGRQHYEQILTVGDWPESKDTSYVFTKRQLENDPYDIRFTPKEVSEYLEQMKIKEKPQCKIWIFGGDEVSQFKDKGLMDEYIMTVIPKKPEEGIPPPINYEGYELVSTQKFIPGFVQSVHHRKSK